MLNFRLVFVFSPARSAAELRSERMLVVRGWGRSGALQLRSDLPEDARMFTVAWRCRGEEGGKAKAEGMTMSNHLV